MTKFNAELFSEFTVTANITPTLVTPSELTDTAETDAGQFDIKVGSEEDYDDLSGSFPIEQIRDGVTLTPDAVVGYVYYDQSQETNFDGFLVRGMNETVRLYKWNGFSYLLEDEVETGGVSAGVVGQGRYEFTGLTNGSQYKVELVNSGNFQINSNPDYEFTFATGGGYGYNFSVSSPSDITGAVYYGGEVFAGAALVLRSSEDAFASILDTVVSSVSGFTFENLYKSGSYVGDPVTYRVELHPDFETTYSWVSQGGQGYVEWTFTEAGSHGTSGDDEYITLGVFKALLTPFDTTVLINAQKTFIGPTDPKPDVKKIVVVTKKRQRKQAGHYTFAKSTIAEFTREQIGSASASITVFPVKATLGAGESSLVTNYTDKSKMARVRIRASAHLSRRVGVLQDPRLNIIKRVHPIQET